MSIGTAQPTKIEQKLIKYHLVGCISPGDVYSAGSFVKYCKREIPFIQSRNSIPFIVGGTYFYIHSLLYGLLNEPFIPNELRKEVNSFDSNQLMKKLQVYDPLSLKVIHPNNLQRLKRALLISIAGGKPFSSFKREGGILNNYDIYAWTIDISRDDLYRNINIRTKQMLQSGWLKEVKSLFEKGYNESSPGLKSLGYPEIVNFLKFNQVHIDNISSIKFMSLIEKVTQKTRNFAKRQLTWLKYQDLLKKIDYARAKNRIDSCILKFNKQL